MTFGLFDMRPTNQGINLQLFLLLVLLNCFCSGRTYESINQQVLHVSIDAGVVPEDQISDVHNTKKMIRQFLSGRILNNFSTIIMKPVLLLVTKTVVCHMTCTAGANFDDKQEGPPFLYY